MRTALLFGLLNAGVALWRCVAASARTACCSAKAAALARPDPARPGFAGADRMHHLAEDAAYLRRRRLHANDSPYQRIVVTANRDDLRLYLNGNLQFSSRDEYRYHEALVHPALARAGRGPRAC